MTTESKVRTSISIDKKLWRKFTLWVFMRDGNRKISGHVEVALREYLERHGGRD